MSSVRKSALVAGILYLVTFVAGIPPSFLYEPVLTNSQYVLGAGAEAQVPLGALLDLVTALAGIGTAVALYSVVRRQHEGLSLGFVTTRIMEAAFISVGALALLSVTVLRQGAASSADPESLSTIGQMLVALRNWTQAFGPGLMPALNALLIGTLMYRSRLIPRAIPALGLISAPILLASTIGIILGINHSMSLWTGLATIPVFFWELSFGLWMTFKGFEPSAPVLAQLPSDMTTSLRSRSAHDPSRAPAGAGGRA